MFQIKVAAFYGTGQMTREIWRTGPHSWRRIRICGERWLQAEEECF
jgi:hypothetical protein